MGGGYLRQWEAPFEVVMFHGLGVALTQLHHSHGSGSFDGRGKGRRPHAAASIVPTVVDAWRGLDGPEGRDLDRVGAAIASICATTTHEAFIDQKQQPANVLYFSP